MATSSLLLSTMGLIGRCPQETATTGGKCERWTAVMNSGVATPSRIRTSRAIDPESLTSKLGTPWNNVGTTDSWVGSTPRSLLNTMILDDLGSDS
jgi:hypothetical protein